MPLKAPEVIWEQKASLLLLRMICSNHGLMGDFIGAFYMTLVPSQTRCLAGTTTSFRGPGLFGPPRYFTTGYSMCLNKMCHEKAGEGHT